MSDMDWRDLGISFEIGPDFSSDIANKGKDYQGEYGHYKYFEEIKGSSLEKAGASVCLVSDQLVPIGLVHSFKLDGVYHVFYYKFMLDLPWEMRGENKFYNLNRPNSRKYVKTKLLETKKRDEAIALVHKAVQIIIDLTEQELAARHKELEPPLGGNEDE